MTRDLFINGLSKVKNGYYIAQCTDRLLIDKIGENYSWDLDYLYKKAFDIRIFNKESEVHIFRSSIDKEFSIRIIESDKDSVSFGDDSIEAVLNEQPVYYDEEQFLDIDTTKIDTINHIVHATGGGEYKLPIENYMDAKILIRNYLGFEKDTGRAYVKDWRIVGFVEGK